MVGLHFSKPCSPFSLRQPEHQQTLTHADPTQVINRKKFEKGSFFSFYWDAFGLLFSVYTRRMIIYFMFILRCRQVYVFAAVSWPASLMTAIIYCSFCWQISLLWCHGIYENPEPGLFTGVKDAGDKHKVVNISTNFRKILNGPNGIPYSLLRGPGETDSWKKPKAKISCQTPFNNNLKSKKLLYR